MSSTMSGKKGSLSKAASTGISTTNPQDAEVEYEIVSANARALNNTKHATKKADEGEDHNTAGLTTNTFTDVSTDASTGVSVNISAEALSQLATAAGEGSVQISGTMLAALVANITSLQGEVGGLQKELGGLKFVLEVAKLDFPDVNTNLEDLQYGSGRRFTLFPKLPLELRKMIWDFAVFVPRVLGIRHWDDAVRDVVWEPSTGPHSVRYVCSESRQAAMKVQKVIIDQEVIGQNGLFFNPFVDIVYFHAPEHVPLDHLPEYHNVMVEVLDDVGYFSSGHPPAKLRFAAEFDYWKGAFSYEDVLCIMLYQLGLDKNTHEGYGVKEALIIVGTPSTPSGSPDLVFIEPRQPIKDLLSADTIKKISLMLPPGVDNNIEGMTWEELEKAEMNMISYFKEERAEWRADMIADEMDPDNFSDNGGVSW